jgi:hypothetical protein
MLEIMQGVSTRAISKRKKSLHEKMKSSQHISNGTTELHQQACRQFQILWQCCQSQIIVVCLNSTAQECYSTARRYLTTFYNFFKFCYVEVLL